MPTHLKGCSPEGSLLVDCETVVPGSASCWRDICVSGVFLPMAHLEVLTATARLPLVKHREASWPPAKTKPGPPCSLSRLRTHCYCPDCYATRRKSVLRIRSGLGRASDWLPPRAVREREEGVSRRLAGRSAVHLAFADLALARFDSPYLACVQSAQASAFVSAGPQWKKIRFWAIGVVVYTLFRIVCSSN